MLIYRMEASVKKEQPIGKGPKLETTDDILKHIFRTEAWGNDQLGLFGASPYAHRPMTVHELLGYFLHYPGAIKKLGAKGPLEDVIRIHCSGLKAKGFLKDLGNQIYQYLGG